MPCPTKNSSPKTNYDTNNHLPSPTKKYVVQKQITKQIIYCRAQQKIMKIACRAQQKTM